MAEFVAASAVESILVLEEEEYRLETVKDAAGDGVLTGNLPFYAKWFR